MTGGNPKKTQYMISMGYLDEVGLLQTTEFERYTGRVNIDNPSKKMVQNRF